MLLETKFQPKFKELRRKIKHIVGIYIRLSTENITDEAIPIVTVLCLHIFNTDVNVNSHYTILKWANYSLIAQIHEIIQHTNEFIVVQT